MDLQSERRLEQFLRILDFPHARLDERMEFVHAQMRLFVEFVEERLVLSLACAIEAARRNEALTRLLARCDPMRMHGLVVRAFSAGGQLVLSCALPRDAGVDDWLACHRTMRRLLDTYARAT